MLSIYTNVAALSAKRNLDRITSKLGISFERLSSGLRINSARDDAGGLAISERMESRVRSYDQARRNVGTGISLVQTAESSLGELGEVLSRMRELAVQAANDSNTASDREQLHLEAKQLVSTLDQLASTAEFNGRKILDGSVSSFVFQTGANNSADERVTLSFDGVRATQLGQLAKTTNQVNATEITTGNLTINSVTIVDSATFGAEVGHDAVNNVQTNSAYAKAKAINASDAGVIARAETPLMTATYAAGTATYDLRINNVVIFSAGDSTSLDDLIQKINLKSDQTGVVAQKVSGLTFSLVAEDGRNINVVGGGEGLVAGGARGFLTLVSNQNINVTGGTPIGISGSSVLLDSNTLQNSVDLETRTAAIDSIDRIDAAAEKILRQRSMMGAYQNRLESTESMLAAISENLSAARSRIRDADFALESAQLVRNQILQQSAATMLAQANLSPQSALLLLQ